MFPSLDQVFSLEAVRVCYILRPATKRLLPFLYITITILSLNVILGTNKALCDPGGETQMTKHNRNVNTICIYWNSKLVQSGNIYISANNYAAMILDSWPMQCASNLAEYNNTNKLTDMWGGILILK